MRLHDGHAAGRRLARQGQVEQLVEVRHVVDGDRAPKVVTELVLDLPGVLPGQDDAVQPVAVGGEDLVVDAGDGEHVPVEGDRAGHGEAGAHGTSRDGRDERGDHGDAGRLAVVGRVSGVDVEVDVGAAMEGEVEAAAGRRWPATGRGRCARTPA